MDPYQELSTLIAQVKIAFAQAHRVEDCRQVYEQAKELRQIARKRKASLEVRQQAACLAIEAERALGEAIVETGLARGAPGNQYSGKKAWSDTTGTGPKCLRDLKISNNVSSRSQLLAKLTGDELRQYLVDQCEQGEEPSIMAARRHAKSLSQPPASIIPIGSNLDEMLQPMSRTDAQTELLDIQKMLDRLLRRMYGGGSPKFTQAEGRLVRQRIIDIGQVARDLGPLESKRD